MPTTTGRPFSIEWRGKPPHMLSPDIPVWYDFLEKWGFQFLRLWYDVLIGGPTLTEREKSDPMKRMWRANTAKRIDALAETKDEVWIIEVAYHAGLRAIGQCRSYVTLWLRDPIIDKPVIPVLVTRDMDPDLIDAAADSDIAVYLV